MTIMVDDARVAIAISIKSRPIFLAIGGGDPNWDKLTGGVAKESAATSALKKFIGWRSLLESKYVKPNTQGDIKFFKGLDAKKKPIYERYSASSAPTASLMVRFALDPEDAGEAYVREVGVFSGTKIKSGLPSGKRFFSHSEIQDRGHLVLLDYVKLQKYDYDVQPDYQFILNF